MYEEAKKLQLIGEILKIEDPTLLSEVETVIANKKQIEKKSGFKDFSGIWTATEADAIKKTIEDSCEQINPNDWK